MKANQLQRRAGKRSNSCSDAELGMIEPEEQAPMAASTAKVKRGLAKEPQQTQKQLRRARNARYRQKKAKSQNNRPEKQLRMRSFEMERGKSLNSELVKLLRLRNTDRERRKSLNSELEKQLLLRSTGQNGVVVKRIRRKSRPRERPTSLSSVIPVNIKLSEKLGMKITAGTMQVQRHSTSKDEQRGRRQNNSFSK